MELKKQDILNRFSGLTEKDIVINDQITITFPNHIYKASVQILNYDIEILSDFIISHRKKKTREN